MDRRESNAFLLTLSDALRPLDAAEEIEQVAMRMLGEVLGASRAFFASVDADGDTAVIRSDYVRGIGSGAGRYSLAAFGSALVPEWRAGRPTTITDVNTDARCNDAERAAFASVSARAAASVPLVKGGRLVALVGVNDAAPREWTDAEVSLLTEVAARVWDASQRAHAEAALRESEAKHRRTHPQDWLAARNDRQARERVHADVERHWLDIFDRVARTGIPERAEESNQPTGRWYDVQVSRVSGHDDRIAIVFDDVTARKQAELALKASEERHAFLLKLSAGARSTASAARRGPEEGIPKSRVGALLRDVDAAHVERQRATVARGSRGANVGRRRTHTRRGRPARERGAIAAIHRGGPDSRHHAG